MKLIKKLIFIVLICALILYGVFIFLFSTNTGINYIVMNITNRIPGLMIESVSGNWRNLNIIHLTYHMPTSVIKIDEIDLSINLKYLLYKQINFEFFRLKNIVIKIQDTQLIWNSSNIKNNFKKDTNFFFKIFSIFIKNLVLHNMHLILNDFEITCQVLQTSLIFQNSLLKFLSVDIKGGSIFNKCSINLLQNILNMNVIQIMSLIKDQLNLKNKFKSFDL